LHKQLLIQLQSVRIWEFQVFVKVDRPGGKKNIVARPRGPQLKFTLKSKLIFLLSAPFFHLFIFFLFFFLCFFFFTFFALFSLFSYFPSFIVTFSHFFSFFSFLYFYIAYGKAFGSRWQTLIKSHSPCWGFFYD
jgi:hypothetical protein